MLGGESFEFIIRITFFKRNSMQMHGEIANAKFVGWQSVAKLGGHSI
jgi:hypothetical protein